MLIVACKPVRSPTTGSEAFGDTIINNDLNE